MSIQILHDRCEAKLHELNLYNKTYQERLNKEMKIIQSQNMAQYFFDCIEKVKNTGKIKNSNHLLTSFLLEITDENPIEKNMDLIITKYAEFPDIDSDFEDTKRELVKDHLIERYGENNVATIIAFGKTKAKNTIKDICRVKNIPFEEVNAVTKFFKSGADEDTIEKAYNNYPEVRAFFAKYEHMNLYKLCLKLEGNVRQPSKHASGFVISPIPLTNVVGLMKAKGTVVTCWEEGIETKELSKVGLVKFDLLGLNTISVISDTVKYIKERHNVDIDPTMLDINDIKVLKQFYDAHSVGVFQFERPELRNLMKKVKISNFSDISAINALNRPGPLDTGMDEVFWKVKNGLLPEKYLHNSLAPILKETYGVICIAKNSNVYLKNKIKKIQDVKSGDLVLTHDGTYKKVLKNIDNGKRKTIRVRVSNGEDLICTYKHLVLTSEGWKMAGKLKKNDLIKSFWMGKEKKEIGNDKDWLIGLALADGDLCADTINIACSNRSFAEKVKIIADKEYELNCYIYKHMRCWYVSLKKNNNIKNKFTKEIENLGLKGKDSYYKFLPNNYNLSMLSGFIEGDRSLFTHQIRIKNSKMAFQIYKAMQEYRIHSSYFYDKKENADTIVFRDIENKLQFRIKKEKRNRRTDVYIPKNNLTYISDKFKQSQILQKNKNNFFTKFMLDKFKCKYEHETWSRVLSVKENIKKQVYDLSIDTNHNFVVGGLVVHNCYQEQIIKVAQVLAGYDADEADNLRRILTKDAQAGRSKGVNPLEKLEKEFIQRCVNNGIIGRVETKRNIYDDVELPTTAQNIKVLEEKMDKNNVFYKIISCNVEIADEIFYQIKSFANYGFNKCLIGSTKVKFDKFKTMKIETIFKNKDKILGILPDVMSCNEEGDQLNTNRIIDVVESGIQEVYLLTTKTRKNLICTKNHKIKTNNGWKELGNIGMNDKIMTMHMGKIYWDDISNIKYKGKAMTYDVSLVNQSHPYFFANNIVVHNSHSAAYAFLAYECMFLKTYYPKEYMSKLLSLTPNTVDKKHNENDFINYIEETKRLGIKVLPPDINKSEYEFVVENDSIRSGFSFLKGVAHKSVNNIIKNRPYKHIRDFLIRTDGRAVNKTVFHALTNSGCFDSFLSEGETIQDRYQFIQELNKFRKNKELVFKETLERTIFKESEICGGEIFNSQFSTYNIANINKKYAIDEKIEDFKKLDIIHENSTLRIFGRIEKIFEKKVGFVDIKNVNHKQTFVLWESDLEFLNNKKNQDKKMLLQIGNVITCIVKRMKDYNGKKSFNILPDTIEELRE